MCCPHSGIATPLAPLLPPLWHIKFICFHITGICTPSAEVAFIAGHKKTNPKQKQKKKKERSNVAHTPRVTIATRAF